MYYLAPIALRAGGIVGRDAVIFSLVAVAMGIAVVPAGRLADRIPRRYVLRCGLLLLGIAYGGLLAPPGLAPVVFGTIASGVGLAFLFVSFQSYVADLLAETERAAAYGRSSALGILATALGPFLAALVFRALPDEILALRVNGVLFAAGALVGIALSLLLPSVHRRAPREERGRWHEAARAAGPVALLYVFMGAGYGMTAPYFTVFFLDHVGLAKESWGFLLAAGTLASAVGSVVAGGLGRRIPPARVAWAGMAGLLGVSMLLAFPLALVFLAVGFLARNFFSTTVAPGMNALIMKRARTGRRAETQAYGSLAWNVGWAVGGAAGGTLLATFGGWLFPLGGALALLGVWVAVLALRRSAPSAAQPSP